MSVGESAVSFPRVAVTCHAYVRRAFGRSASDRGAPVAAMRRAKRKSTSYTPRLAAMMRRHWLAHVTVFVVVAELHVK